MSSGSDYIADYNSLDPAHRTKVKKSKASDTPPMASPSNQPAPTAPSADVEDVDEDPEPRRKKRRTNDISHMTASGHIDIMALAMGSMAREAKGRADALAEMSKACESQANALGVMCDELGAMSEGLAMDGY
jgi:hypothetical protein